MCVCLYFVVRISLPPRWLIRCLSEGGLSRCLHPCLGPLEHGANHFSGQSSHGPALPSLAQDSLVTPRINKLELCQLGGVDRQRGQDRQREEDDLRVVSILNNLLMGLPSISNFGTKVVRTIFIHVSSNRAKRDFSRVSANADKWHYNISW